MTRFWLKTLAYTTAFLLLALISWQSLLLALIPVYLFEISLDIYYKKNHHLNPWPKIIFLRIWGLGVLIWWIKGVL